MERIKRLNALGMNLIGASDELKNYTKEIIKDCSSIAFGLYRGEIDATTADRTQTLIREARWRKRNINQNDSKLNERKEEFEHKWEWIRNSVPR